VYFGEVEEGVYILVEMEAPGGYQFPKGQWRIYVEPQDENPIAIEAIKINNAFPPGFISGETLKLPNYKILILPVAGSIGQLVCIIIGFFGMGGAILLLIVSSKKKRRARVAS